MRNRTMTTRAAVLAVLALGLAGAPAAGGPLEREKRGLVTKSGWTFYYTVNNEGTKSEGTHGHLLFKGAALPACFDVVTGPLGKFSYVTRRVLWGEHGWTRIGEDTRANEAVRRELDEGDLARGWYAGPGSRIGTPESWVQVKRGERSWWTDPARLADLAKAEKLPSLGAWDIMKD